jgi:GT2 family glycosyltransferase
MPDVSIIIVNWNTRQLLADCINDVKSYTHDLTYEIIVVDNASSDGSQEMVRATFPDVHLIANNENVGFARANNQAIRCSRGRYVLLLNSDAFVRDQTIAQTVAFMDAHPAAGMVGCKLRYADGRLQPSCTTFPTLFTELLIATQLERLFPKSRLFGAYRMTYWDFNDIREVDVIMGAYMLVRATAIEQLGMLDESYFMYSEEVDWCYRFKQNGWKVYFYPYVETIHLWGGSSKPVRVEMLIQLYLSRVAFFRRYYGTTSANLLKLIVGFSCLLRIGPGSWYYLLTANAQQRQKHYAFRKLLRVLPSM